MTVEPGRQGLELLLSGLLGIGLGVVYDLGRALRREHPGATIPADGTFALVFFLTLWLSGIYMGGLRLYHCLGIGLGAAGYFLTLSAGITGAFRGVFRFFGRLRTALGRTAKKTGRFLKKLAKKLFPSTAIWGTIGKASTLRTRRREPRP